MTGTRGLDDWLSGAFATVRAALRDADRSRDAGRTASLLQTALYRDWYCAVGEKPQVHGGARDLAELLRAAHAGSRRWEAGWRVARASGDGRLAVTRGPERRVVHVIDCLPETDHGTAIGEGTPVSVVERRCSESLNPGDWVSFDSGWHGRRAPLLRVYWNVLPMGAARIVAALTEGLAPGAGFFLKAPRSPSDYDRRDALVLYLPRDGFAAALPALRAAMHAAADMLCDPVPPLTARLAPGIGLAEDPGAQGESFGTSRCGLVARAVAEAVERGVTDDTAWHDAVGKALDRAGIPRDRPWADSAASPDYLLS